MNVADYINQHGPAAVARAIEADPAFSVFNLMWGAPEEILPACQRLGLTTVDDVVGWVHRVNAAVGNPQAFVSNVDPDLKLDMAAMPTIQWPDIHKAVAEQCKTTDHFFLDHSDRTYRLPTKAQWDAIAAACPSHRRRHSRSEAHDCDDFVRHFQGWLASKGYGNLAHGFAATLHYRGTAFQGGHAVVLCVDADRKVWQIEPQAGKLFAADYAKLGGFFLADTVRLARLYF